MADLFLSRATLRRDAPLSALVDVLLPEENDKRVVVTHKLLWTLFADGPQRKRDFLWREARPGLYYLLSARPPRDAHGLFHIDPPKPFIPALAPGDRLQFSLRANPTIARKTAGVRGRRSDVVMNAIKPLPKEGRATARTAAIQEAGVAWLQSQAKRHGFAVLNAVADRYCILTPPHRGARMRLATLDFSGTIQVVEPERFAAALAAGIGRGKAFGCGLMLVRRA